MSSTRLPIPIKNLFYLLCYAWDVLSIRDTIKVSESDFTDAYNLLARVFSFGLGKLIKTGFHRSYVERVDELSCIKGKVLISENIENFLTKKPQLQCSFDDYSINNDFNGILIYTINSLVHSANVETSIKQDLRKKSRFFNTVEEVIPSKSVRRCIVLNKNNVIYKLLLNISFMLYDNTSIDEESGNSVFKDFFRDEQMSRVFEKFILNFYAHALPREKYKVHAPKIDWHMSEQAVDEWGDLFEIDTNPGERRTDIVIENKEKNTQLIIDAKYYSKTFVKAYQDPNEERVRTSHLNQVRGYVLDSDYSGRKIGALVYPMTNNDLKKGKVIPIQDSNIILKTINLASDWREIESDLLTFVNKIDQRRAVLP